MTIGLLWYGMPFPASGCVWLWDFGFKTSLDNYLSCLLQQGCTQQRLVCRVASPSKTIVSFHLCKEVLGGPIEYSFGDPGILSFLFREFAKACQAGWCFRLCPQTLKFREHFGSNQNQKNKLYVYKYIYTYIYIYIIMKKISEFAVCCMCVCVCTARVSIITVNTYPHDHVQYRVLRICKCIYLNI